MQLAIGLVIMIALGTFSWAALNLQYYTCIRAFIWYRIASWARANGDAAVLRQARKDEYQKALVTDIKKKRSPMLVAPSRTVSAKKRKKVVHFGIVEQVISAYNRFLQSVRTPSPVLSYEASVNSKKKVG